MLGIGTNQAAAAFRLFDIPEPRDLCGHCATPIGPSLVNRLMTFRAEPSNPAPLDHTPIRGGQADVRPYEEIDIDTKELRLLDGI